MDSILPQIEHLRDQGVKMVRVIYSDIHGVARGKDISLEVLNSALLEGVSFCIAILSDDLAGNLADAPGLSLERGHPDMQAKPLVSTLTPLPWEPETAWCLAELEDESGPIEYAPRSFLERVLEHYSKRGLTPIVGPELEFYLFRYDEQGQLHRYTDQLSIVYSVGRRADPQGVVREMVSVAQSLSLLPIAAHHEMGRGQFEINLQHGEALNAADRAFLFRTMVKEVAAQHGWFATFMGRPFNDDFGSGLHLHLSLNDSHDRNCFALDTAADGLSSIARHFVAGILEHASALMAFLLPTINAYKRPMLDGTVPRAANWAYDNRAALVRVPPGRGTATHLELRRGDASANPYLAIGVTLLAGLDGIDRKVEPPEVIHDAQKSSLVGSALPRTLEASLAALRDDTYLCQTIGSQLVNAFCAIKNSEVERFHAHVTEWELKEYLWHL